VLDADNRQAAIDALLVQLQIPPASAVVDPSRTLVRIGERLWTVVKITPVEESGLSGSQRRAGAKHKQVR
jgi:hypothetical protein